MVLGGCGVLCGLAFGIALEIKLLHKRREHQQSALPAAVYEVPVGFVSGDAPACTLSVMMPVHRLKDRKPRQEPGPRVRYHAVMIGARVDRASLVAMTGRTDRLPWGPMSPSALVDRERVVLGAGSDRATACRAGVAGGFGRPTLSSTLKGVDEMRTEETLSSAWDQHLASEFAAKSPEQALATMTAEPYVNVVALMIGARGRDEVRDFYANHFLSQIPPDMETVPVSRTIGQGRVVDELIMRFTHSIRMDWLLPGIPPTGKRVEVPMVAIVQFEGDKVAHEHIYWDQASVLVQVGLLDRSLPVRGGEIAAQVLNPTQPMNELIRRATTNTAERPLADR